MDPQLIIFAIEAAVKIGRKIYDVLVDSMQARPLLLPVGTLAGSIAEADANLFFLQPEYIALISDGGPYTHLRGKPQIVDAYLTVRHINAIVGVGESDARGAATIMELQRFEQYKAGFGPRPAIQRILGTIVEVGVDYFAANPEALGKDSSARKILAAFIKSIDEVDFAESDPTDIVHNVLIDALTVLVDHPELVAHDERLSLMLGGVTLAVRDEIKAIDTAASEGEKIRRTDLIKRIGVSIIKGGAGTVADNSALFLRGEGRGKEAVRATVTSILDSVRGSDDLFSSAGLEHLVDTSLNAVADNAVFIRNDVLRSLLKNTVHELTTAEARDLFGEAAIEHILIGALETVAENSETLIDPTSPQKEFLSKAVAAMAQGLAGNLAGGGKVKALFSTAQLIELAKIVFTQVADHPERLLGGATTDPRRTALAQILASVAASLGDDPTRLVTGAGLMHLIETAVQVAVKNQDKLLNLSNDDPRSNLLQAILAAVSGGLLGAGANGRLVDRDTWIEIGQRILPLVSNNLDQIIGTDAHLIRDTIAVALALGTGALENRLNADNFPELVEGLLRKVLLDQLAPGDAAAVASAADELLRLAA